MSFAKIKNFLTAQEKIAGITISDSKISIAFLKSISKKKKQDIIIEKLKEIELPEGTIDRGLVKNKQALINSFEKLLLDLYSSKKKIPKIIPAILSFPSQKIYSQLFDFPDRIGYDKLEESMKLTVGFSLPLKIDDCYLDWEIVGFEEKKTFLAQVQKEIINQYLEVLNKVSILPIACEFHLLSLNRIISFFEENSFCLAFIDSHGIEVGICKEKTLRFVESIYWDVQNTEVPKQKIIEELIFKVINFYQTDKIDSAEINKIYLIGESSEILSLSNYLKEKLKKEVILPKIPFEIKVPKGIAKIKSKISKLTNLRAQKNKELQDFEEKSRKEIAEIKNKLVEIKTKKENLAL